VRVLIAEDSAILRDGLAALLVRRGHDVVGAVPDAVALRAAYRELMAAGEAPDVVVVDVRMPPAFTDEGLRAAVELRAEHPGQALLVFSQYVETQFAARLFADDPRGLGYLLKDRVADVGEFVAALGRLVEGQTVLDPEVVSQLLGASRGDGGLERLTAREREVLALMAEGRSNGAIAEALYLSYGAVEKNVTAIFDKLDLAADAADHRRVLAVLRYLRSRSA
jgi:DNA-binding NarL/FixJ family response regulator